MTAPHNVEDPYIGQYVSSYDVNTLEDTALAVDASFFLQKMLERNPSREPLMCALAGLTGIHIHIETELDQWKSHKITPFFIFDGLPIVGQDDVQMATGQHDIRRTNEAWDIYFGGHGERAVLAFGNTGPYKATFPPQNLFPLLQGLLRKRGLHYLVAPFNASAQIAYFDMIGSEQVGGIMGSTELLLYPIHDHVILDLDWSTKRVQAVSKRQLVGSLNNINESIFIDSLLMMGTSFLPMFPPLLDPSLCPRQPSVNDAYNLLRTSNKSIESVCSIHGDLLKAQEPNWLDKFFKARLAVEHFVYIAESGEIKVNDYDKLTKDNNAYLGLQLPAELFHYLNTGLVGPRVMSWLTHLTVTVRPTLDGFVSDEYRNLVTKQLVPYYAAALSLTAQRLNRPFEYQDVRLKVWYDPSFSEQIVFRGDRLAGGPAPSKITSWRLTDEVFAKHFTKPASGSLSFELRALSNPGFIRAVRGLKKALNMESGDAVVSLTWWRLLTLRGYVTERDLALTPWGAALAKTMEALAPLAEANPAANVHAAAYLAFELMRLGLLNAKRQHEALQGLPLGATEEAKVAVVLASRAATLLPLRQEVIGYTGPLSKNLLTFRSLATTVGDANRAVIDALLLITFTGVQAKQERDDYWEIGHRLPFTEYPDVALGIAAKTYLDDDRFYDLQSVDAATQAARKTDFQTNFVPRATHLYEDLDMFFDFFNALCVGVAALDDGQMSADDKRAWATTKQFIAARR